jgi:outer membrane lipoprotein-sorting protein
MKKLALTLLFITFYSLNSFAAKQAVSNDHISDKIKKYLDNIRTMAVEFEQTDAKGASAKGMLLIAKPYKFRCNYYAPFPLLIVGNKNYVAVYDFEMEHFSRIKAEENVFNFLLLDKTELDNQFDIIAQNENPDNYELILRHEELGRTSSIIFGKKSGQIERIKIEEDDNIISIKFAQIKDLNKLDNNLFILKDPELFGKPRRLDRSDMENIIK